MTRFSRLEVFNTLLDKGVVPLFFNADVDKSSEVIAACTRGGAQVIEFTNRGEGAYTVFTQLVEHFAKVEPSLMLGVGSVIDAPTAAMFLAAGAAFVVSPILSPEIARLCNLHKMAYLPGCATPTEISQAEELGAEIVKVFPGQVVGPEFIKATLGPCPWHRLMPTGGVDATEESVSAWIKAGACAVGLGSNLISAQVIKEKQYDTLSEKVSQSLAWVKKARAK